MKRWIVAFVAGMGLINGALAQEFVGPASMGSQEPLYKYDDQEKWKHGWMQDMPYYGGFHAFRPYNYHHVFGQATTAQGWGMSQPYSQQFWHRYEHMTNLANAGDHGASMQPVPQQLQQPYPQQMFPQQQYPQEQGYPQPLPQMYPPQDQQPIYQRQMEPQMMGPAGAWNAPPMLPQLPPAQAIQTSYAEPAQSRQQRELLGYLNDGPGLPRPAF